MFGAPGRRHVEVAVDAAAIPGGRTFTYHVPARLADLVPGEAVLVEYGRRRAIGIVLSEADEPDRETKPILERVRSDGPLLAPLQLGLAAHIASYYLAPAALVVRQMLPPGLLERVELVARASGARVGSEDGERDPWSVPPPVTGASGRTTAQLDASGLLVRVNAAGPDGITVDELLPDRATRPRLIRQLARTGLVDLVWILRAPTSRARLERVAHLTDAGRAATATSGEDLGAGSPAGGTGRRARPLGPRQRALLAELSSSVEGEAPAALLAGRHGAGAVTGLARRGLIELGTRVVERRPLHGRATGERGSRPVGAELTAGQSAVVEHATRCLRERRSWPVLLEGVPAGGKTAVYAAVVEAALAAGRQALILVPEIALAVPIVDRLRHDLGVDVAVLHSALGEGERADEWRRIRGGQAPVVVGTRLAVLAPLADPGIVVVDEEHDPAYKSDRTPRYQARDVALVLGRLAGAPVILGSATPDVVSVGRALDGKLERVRLPERLGGRRPTVEVVDLRQELAAGNRGLLSASLAGALARLDRASGERAILVINRRGSASVVLCRDCGYVQVCPECQRPLVFHAAGLLLRCHHCGASAPVARRCPACGSPRIRYLGGGTQRVEREVRSRFPAYQVGRLDRDVVERKGEASRVVDAFTEGALDVLVGTSLVTKGLDVPEVTLVGVVSADVALNLPDERAAERTYQFLAQAIGRAGRGTRPGHAIVQTYRPDHPAVVAATATGPDAPSFVDRFYGSELASRRDFGSPPFGMLVKLTAAHEDRGTAEETAADMATRLRERTLELDAGVSLLGPAPAYVARRGGRWRFHVVLRGRDPLAVLGGDPGRPWSVDVDPESLL